MKCLAIGGEPATGKTTLMREVLKMVKPSKKFKYGLLRGYIEPFANVSVLGIYEHQEVFAGTDKLSMAVQKDFDKFVQLKTKNIIFEGDRLFTKKNLLYLTKNYETRIIILKNEKKIIASRHINRGDNQSETFKKSRHTKISNIISEPNLKHIEFYKLNDISESESLAAEIYNWFFI